MAEATSESGIYVEGFTFCRAPESKNKWLFLDEEKPRLVIWSNHKGLVGFGWEYFQFLWDASSTA
jgi:hypothetical protein